MHPEILKEKKIVLASNNKGKIGELEEMLAEYQIEVISGADLNFAEPEENGKTFGENAKIKSDYFAEKTKLPSLADDSGLVIPSLNGDPGIYSARWAIDPKTGERNFSKAIKKVEQKLIEKTKSNKNHSAHFICALSLTLKNGKNFIFNGRIDGKLIFPPKGNNGFGYDPIFIAEGREKTFGEISQKEKNQMNHRSIAFGKFKNMG